MRILMVGNTASIGHNLKKGLRAEGIDCDLICSKETILISKSDDKPNGKYDLIHLNCPIALRFWLNWEFVKRIFITPIVTHWHGDDLRTKKPIRRLLRWYFLKRSKAILYSTKNLKKHLPEDAIWLPTPIDTDQFKPMKVKEKNLLKWGSGKIPHDSVPEYLNRFEACEIRNASEAILTASFLEALACGLKVKGFENYDRNYVIENHSIPAVTKKVIRIYKKALSHNIRDQIWGWILLIIFTIIYILSPKLRSEIDKH